MNPAKAWPYILYMTKAEYKCVFFAWKYLLGFLKILTKDLNIFLNILFVFVAGVYYINEYLRGA